MKKYTLPEIEIVKFEATDIVTLSGTVETKNISDVTSSEGFEVAAFNSDWQNG